MNNNTEINIALINLAQASTSMREFIERACKTGINISVNKLKANYCDIMGATLTKRNRVPTVNNSGIPSNQMNKSWGVTSTQ